MNLIQFLRQRKNSNVNSLLGKIKEIVKTENMVIETKICRTFSESFSAYNVALETLNKNVIDMESEITEMKSIIEEHERKINEIKTLKKAI